MNETSKFLVALANGDSEVIMTIYKENFPKVKSFVLRNKGQLEDAEDIFQKALLQIAVRYKKEPFIITSSFEGYLFTVCKNLWRRELNKSKKKVTGDGFFEPMDNERDMALATLEQERWELFTECLNKISENCKIILQLFFARTPYSVIVEKMKYSSETVARQRVFKCKAKLTELIKNHKRYNSLKDL